MVGLPPVLLLLEGEIPVDAGPHLPLIEDEEMARLEQRDPFQQGGLPEGVLKGEVIRQRERVDLPGKEHVPHVIRAPVGHRIAHLFDRKEGDASPAKVMDSRDAAQSPSPFSSF